MNLKLTHLHFMSSADHSQGDLLCENKTTANIALQQLGLTNSVFHLQQKNRQ